MMMTMLLNVLARNYIQKVTGQQLPELTELSQNREDCRQEKSNDLTTYYTFEMRVTIEDGVYNLI